LCSATGIALGTPVTFDNCGVTSIVNNAPASFPVGTTVVIWTVTDIDGNTATANQNVIVNDNQNPTITVPADITVNANIGLCSATGIALGTPVTFDNCGVTSIVNNAPASFPVGTNVVVWTVTDIHGNTATANQNVIVIDNQNPTITAPAAVTVKADAGKHTASGVVLGTPVTADNCGVQTVTNNAPSSFPAGTTVVTWTVTDLHGNTNTATQSVTVIDNQPPTITSPVAVSIPENSTSVMTVTATDPDIGDSFTFSISGGADAGKFTIDATTGELKFITAPDFEIPTDADLNNIYVVNVTVTDAGGLSDTKTISVTVTDVNDAPADIILSNNMVYEHQAKGTTIGTFTTIDEDAGDTHVYTIQPGNDASSFALSNDTLQTAAVFDYNTKQVYIVTIRTTDQGGLYVDKDFTIMVKNVNEPPQILDNNNNPADTLYFDAYDNETLQICLNVFDPDHDKTGISDVHLLGGTSGATISDKDDCIDYLSAGSFVGKDKLFVKVTDNGTPPLSDSAIIIINVHPTFIISQGISPNNDGVNDVWLIDGIERHPDNAVTIFSRYGDIVYKIKGYNNTTIVWKGEYNTGQKSNSEAPDGTYFYLIEIANGPKLTGFIVLKR
jgi:gliding motility-associated-like protein